MTGWQEEVECEREQQAAIREDSVGNKPQSTNYHRESGTKLKNLTGDLLDVLCSQYTTVNRPVKHLWLIKQLIGKRKNIVVSRLILPP